MWYNESVFYQIYPLGFCGAPQENDGVVVPRIKKVCDWVDHIKSLGANAIYFSPVFQSVRHGYDTSDYRIIDSRLGTNADFAQVCKVLHASGIRVVLDGVFNHVGRNFWAFVDVKKNREKSEYVDWFNIDFSRDNEYGDGFYYEDWEGHNTLVKLNLKNDRVVEHLFSCIQSWVNEFDIDGLRLDVAYLLSEDFLGRLRSFCDTLKPEFYLLGEVIHGDYNQFVGEGKLDSVTNYDCHKGLHSSFNCMNMFEIAHSLLRQFGDGNGQGLYKGKHLLSFVDNHDLSRIASVLSEPRHLPLIYGLMFGMPGIPCVYYGSEWGERAEKTPTSDSPVRVSFDAPQKNELTQLITTLAGIKKSSRALNYGSFSTVVLTNKQLAFLRECDGEKMIISVNAEDVPFIAHFGVQGEATELFTGEKCSLAGDVTLEPYSLHYYRI